jgi:hypothetical protein
VNPVPVNSAVFVCISAVGCVVDDRWVDMARIWSMSALSCTPSLAAILIYFIIKVVVVVVVIGEC